MFTVARVLKATSLQASQTLKFGRRIPRMLDKILKDFCRISNYFESLTRGFENVFHAFSVSSWKLFKSFLSSSLFEVSDLRILRIFLVSFKSLLENSMINIFHTFSRLYSEKLQ